ncbi:hypothetical protein ACLMJK_000185 [Lecanora helva]
MLSLPRGHHIACSSVLRCSSPAFSTSLRQQYRSYATPPKPKPKPRPYNTPSAPSKADASTKTSPPIPLQSVLPNRSTSKVTSRINPPSTTHPPTLSLPTRTPDLPFYKYYFRLGKAYATFYKTGLFTHLWGNFRLARSLPQNAWSASPTRVHSAVRDGTLSRADFQLLRRAKSDTWRVPPFALLFAICGEFTPLVIVFVTGLVPRVIWIPKQVRGKREKARSRRRQCRTLSGFGESGGEMVLRGRLEGMEEGARKREAYRYVAQSLGLYSEVLDRWVPYLIPDEFVRRRVERRIRDLEVDDFAIRRDGGVRNMNVDEVVRACEERGMEVLDRGDGELRDELSKWVEERAKLSKKTGKM